MKNKMERWQKIARLEPTKIQFYISKKDNKIMAFRCDLPLDLHFAKLARPCMLPPMHVHNIKPCQAT